MAPVADLHSQTFWEGLRLGKVVVQHCADCGMTFFPHLPNCPECAGRKLSAQTSPGTGTIYSWVRVHRALSDDPVVSLPYAIVTVDLDEGGRIFGRMEPHESASIGATVQAGFVDHGDWTELVFHPRNPRTAGAGR
jgi:uncharacterized OB-fold protein